MTTTLKLTRSQILAFRHRAAALDERLPRDRSALRRAAWAGCTPTALRVRARTSTIRVVRTIVVFMVSPILVRSDIRFAETQIDLFIDNVANCWISLVTLSVAKSVTVSGSGRTCRPLPNMLL